MPRTPTELVERFYNVVWKNADEAETKSLLDAGFRFRGSLGAELQGPDGFIAYMRSVHARLKGSRARSKKSSRRTIAWRHE